jgi:hypothetical protein
MKKFYHMMGLTLLLLLVASAAFGQRPRMSDETPKPEQDEVAKPEPTPPPAPKFAKAKYMGGYFGLRQKQEGSISFDDRSQRLVFRDKQEREVLSISYDAVIATFADAEERKLMGAGTQTVVMGTAGILGLPAMLFKKKFQYFTIQYKDPDTGVDGTTQFKMNNKELVRSMAHTLADKAGLAQRGQVYVRRKDSQTKSENKETVP